MNQGVAIAARYNPDNWRAAGMYIKQFQFPLTYDSRDRYTAIDHDRLFQQFHDHATRMVEKHIPEKGLWLSDWARRVSDDRVLALLADLVPHATNVQPNEKWTGYRILRTNNRSNGFPVWTLELFSKHPDSGTAVYTGPNAPNVEQPKRVLNNRGYYGTDDEP